jgi:hypothetical protein
MSTLTSPRLTPGLIPVLAGALLAVAACSSGTEPVPPPPVDCSQVAPTILAVGEHTIIDANQTGCVRFPAAVSGGAEYLYVALATAGNVSRRGLSVPYRLTGGPPAVAVAASLRRPLLRVTQAPSRAEAFHQRLRILERELSRHPAARRPNGLAASVASQPPPVLNEKRTFNVLRSADSSGTSPGDYVQVTGTAKYIGRHVAIFVDDAAPSPGFSQSDIDHTGATFDDHLYPIDSTAFGRESDINGDGLVLVLLTDEVTRLAGCSGGQVVIGYFFPVDLIPGAVGSNEAEIFYGLAPDPGCDISPADAAELIPRVFIHEFQHMINYNQHVLVRSGTSEDTWLNEGLSTFAEELGGRLVPDSLCINNDCFSQFTVGDLTDGNAYLLNVESNYLVGPDTVPIPLAQYGAAWLFVRWLGDHFSQTPLLATDLTQRLVATSQTGSDNVSSATGVDFPTLVSEWQMANYLDNLPGFTPASPRLEYESWDYRQVYAALHQQDPFTFPLSYPLVPDSTTGSYSRTDSLKAGSGRHVVISQPPSSGELDFKLTGSDGTSALPATAEPRIAIVRIR